MVIALKESVDLVELRGLQIRNLADCRPVIWMIRWKERAEHRHRREAVGTILVVLPALVQHDVPLIREFRLRQRGQKKSHPVRFHPERELERAGGYDFPTKLPLQTHDASSFDEAFVAKFDPGQTGSNSLIYSTILGNTYYGYGKSIAAYTDSSGNYRVFLPSLRTNASGPSWASGPTPGTSVPMSQFFVATPSSTAAQINAALAQGCNLFFTPGVYSIDQTLNVTGRA